MACTCSVENGKIQMTSKETAGVWVGWSIIAARHFKYSSRLHIFTFQRRFDMSVCILCVLGLTVLPTPLLNLVVFQLQTFWVNDMYNLEETGEGWNQMCDIQMPRKHQSLRHLTMLTMRSLDSTYDQPFFMRVNLSLYLDARPTL